MGPCPVCAEECIGEDDELSHDGGDGDFSGFPSGDESLIFGFHVGVEACCNKGWHVECLAQDSTPTADVTTPAILSAVARNRRQAGEARDLFVFELAEFGHLDEHGDSGNRADAGDRDEDLEARHQFRLAAQPGLERCVDGGDLAVDLRQALGGMALEQGRTTRMLAVLGGGSILDQGEPGDVEFLHVVNGLAVDRSHWQRQQRPHASEHGGIDRVGLGVAAGGLGKAPRL